MKFSIVTPSYNSGAYIEETIQSVRQQSYKNFEHIVIDGCSTDNTTAILEQHDHLCWVSEPDRGQSDAINKGFRLADGDIFAWQNADDLYFPQTFETVAAFFQQHPSVDFVYGYYQLIDTDGEWICDVRPGEWNQWLFAHGRGSPLQPTVFWRRRISERVGEIDERLHYCMDIDFFARACKHFSFRRIPEMLGQFRVHPESKTQAGTNRQKIMKENREVLSRHFDYSRLDHALFTAFRYRARLARSVKERWLPRA